MMKQAGYRPTLVVFGVILGVVGAAAALALRMPDLGGCAAAAAGNGVAARDYAPGQVLKTAGVLADVLHDDDDVDRRLDGDVAVRGIYARLRRRQRHCGGLAALPLALTIDRLTNGLTRPFFGWVSDKIGRENTMVIAFLMEARGWLMVMCRDNALVFVILSGVVFFGWGEIFSLFPSTLTDTFGAQHATTNYGLLYVAQGVGSILGGPAAACCSCRREAGCRCSG